MFDRNPTRDRRAATIGRANDFQPNEDDGQLEKLKLENS
jgi:hypothetical protein